MSLELFAAVGNESLDVFWSRGAPSASVKTAYWPEMGSATCDTCPNGPLMLDLSGGLGLKLVGSGPQVQANICWTASACLAFYQDGTGLASASGSILCATGGGDAVFVSECGVGEEELRLEASGGLQAANFGCVGMSGGGASASGVYTAALSVSPSFCPSAGGDATSWALWSDEFSPPGVALQVRGAPSPGASGANTRWSISLKSSATEAFRGGFGSGTGLRATNMDTGAVVDFPASAYVQHAAWGGGTLFIMISSTAEYSTIGAALEAQWSAAFPGPSNANPIPLNFGPSPGETDACDPTANPRFTGYEASGSSYCYASVDVDAGNELLVSLGGKAQLVLDGANASFVPRASVGGLEVPSRLVVSGVSSSGARYTLVPSTAAASQAHRVRTVRRGLNAAQFTLPEVAWEPEGGGAAVADTTFLELTAWADCLALGVQSLRGEGALGGSLSLAAVELRWSLGGNEHVSAALPAPDGSVGLRVCVGDGGLLAAANTSVASPPANVAVGATYAGAALTTEWVATTGESVVRMPSSLPKCGYGNGCADVHEVTVSVTADAGARVRLVLARNFHRTRNFYANSPGAEITGVSAGWVEGGVPSGRPLQVSKNWHVDASTPAEPYEGSWWTLASWVVVPSSGSWTGVCRVHYAGVVASDAAANAEGVLAASSHAQLSLVGWGSYGLWEQAWHSAAPTCLGIAWHRIASRIHCAVCGCRRRWAAPARAPRTRCWASSASPWWTTCARGPRAAAWSRWARSARPTATAAAARRTASRRPRPTAPRASIAARQPPRSAGSTAAAAGRPMTCRRAPQPRGRTTWAAATFWSCSTKRAATCQRAAR